MSLQIEDFLTGLFYFIRNSPKRLRELHAAAQLEESENVQVMMPGKVHGTRWLSHKVNALKALQVDYVPLVTYFQDACSRDSTSLTDKGKIKKCLQLITTYKFVLDMSFFQDVFRPLSQLSECFQNNDTWIGDVCNKIAFTMAALNKCKTQSGPKLAAVLKDLASSDTYHGVELKHPEGKDQFHTNKKKIVDSIEENLNSRFANLSNNPLISSFGIFDPANWPTKNDVKLKENLAGYGDHEIDNLFQHFQPILEKHGFDITCCKEEWLNVKTFIARKFNSYGSLKPSNMWERIMSESS